MYVLDTNVVSELMRPAPDPVIERWVAERPTRSLFLTAVTEAELRFGLAIMPKGKRWEGLSAAFDRMLRSGLANRVLPFDSRAARAYAGIAAVRRQMGRPIEEADCQIAAIARVRGMVLARRNIRDFEDTGLAICDPLKAA